MARALALLTLGLLLLLSGCASQASHAPSVLQRYAGMQRQLASIAPASARLAGDVSRLAKNERRGWPRGSRSAASRLARDATGFIRRSGELGNRVRHLARSARPGVVRRYLVNVRASLTSDWYEGSALVHLTRVLRRDPYGLVPETAATLRRYQRRALRDARRARTFAAAAAALKRQYPRRFRYVPVTTS